MREPIMREPSAYPDDLLQNQEDRHRPPVRQAQALSGITDHARQNQGGGPTGEVGGDRPAENFDSALSPIDGRDVLPGDDPRARGENHWDAPLPVRVHLAGGPTLRTLRDAGDFLSGRHVTLDHSPALQDTALAAVQAARTGAPEDLAQAGELLQAYVGLMRLG